MRRESSGPAGTDQSDVRPVVRTASGNRGPWLFAGSMVACAILLFSLLESRRENVNEPLIETASDPSRRISAPPDLFIPSGYYSGPADREFRRYERYAVRPPFNRAPTPRRASEPVQEPAVPRARTRSQRYVQPEPPAPIPYVQPIPQPNYDNAAPRPLPIAAAPDPASQQDRVRAFRFASPTTTIAKGTIIQAVLETALDSTRPGFARAVVSRDVFGFDGSRILIPKGSQLIGEYKSDLAPGQNRALVQWQRLMRPDGVVVNLDSPAIDPLGRAGVRGAVDTHFLERFAGALLQTALNVGSQVALDRVSRGTVVYLPTPGQSQQVGTPDRVQRTLRVKQGSSVSVFVAKDLDFTTVES